MQYNPPASFERLRSMVDYCPTALILTDTSGLITHANDDAGRLFGYDRDALKGVRLDQLVPEVLSAPSGHELRGLRGDHREIPIDLKQAEISTDRGPFLLCTIVDLSGWLEGEVEKARLSERALAGGIAHDLNNVLGGIMGFAELIRSDLTDEAAAQADLNELLELAWRGRRLATRILGIGGRPARQPDTLDLGRIANDVAHHLRTMLPETIDVRLRIAPETPAVSGDAQAVYELLEQLARNAIQAMPDGGTLELTVERVDLQGQPAQADTGLGEGRYVVLQVRDTGHGMSPEILARARDPYFTTRPPGAARGLGLPKVVGIVEHHRGAVTIESAPGQGSTVRCYFPAAGGPLDPSTDTPLAPGSGPGGRILLVDDEPALVSVGTRQLMALGYTVTAFSDPLVALETFRLMPEEFDFVLTDLSMPGMSGLDLASELSRIRPELPITLVSGYSERIPAARLTAAGVRQLVHKPVTMQELAAIARSALARA